LASQTTSQRTSPAGKKNYFVSKEGLSGRKGRRRSSDKQKRCERGRRKRKLLLESEEARGTTPTTSGKNFRLR